MALLFPILSLLCGFGLARLSLNTRLKTLFSSLLARVFIPVVIVYNMVFYREGSLTLIGLSLAIAIVLYVVFWMLSRDRLQALCFSYTNIGWLGLPVAIAIFGPSVSAAMIALYIGGSLYGNIWAVSAVSTTPQSLGSIIKKLLQSPPVMALFSVVVLRFIGIQHWTESNGLAVLDAIYVIAKWGMSFTGMCVLGMWLAGTKVDLDDLKISTRIALFKMGCGVLICALISVFLPLPAMEHALALLFLLFCLPPAANIVALETHYQGTGTSAKYIAAGTMVSGVILIIYALLLHLYWLG